MRRCWRRILMKSKVLKPSSNTNWFSHSLSSLAVCETQGESGWGGLKNIHTFICAKQHSKTSDIPWGFLRLHQLSFGRQWHRHRNGWADAGARKHRCLEDVDLFSSPSSRRRWHQAKWRVINSLFVECSVVCNNPKRPNYHSKYTGLIQYKYWFRCCTYVGWKSAAHVCLLSFAVFIWVFVSYLSKLVFIALLNNKDNGNQWHNLLKTGVWGYKSGIT